MGNFIGHRWNYASVDRTFYYYTSIGFYLFIEKKIDLSIKKTSRKTILLKLTLTLSTLFNTAKKIGLVASGKKGSSLDSTNRNTEMKFRHREIYKLLSTEKKEALLLQRRIKRQESKTYTLTEVPASHEQAQRAIDFQRHYDGFEQQNPHLLDIFSVSATASTITFG